MIQAELRAKVRELIALGVLPADPPPITRPAPTSTPGRTPSRTLIGGPLHEPCTICGEPGPQVQYFYLAGPGRPGPRCLRRDLAAGAGAPCVELAGLSLGGAWSL